MNTIDTETTNWKAYCLLLKLESGMHMGYLKTGNIQRTRLYLTGRSIWGALTARLTRLTDNTNYAEVGEKVNQYLAWSYFFPTLKRADETLVLLPKYRAGGLSYSIIQLETGESHGYLETKQVERALLYSINSTALDYTRKAAQDQSLHEVEFISPKTLNELQIEGDAKGSQVYLGGYLFVSKEAEADPVIKYWKEAFACLQFGGERSYGGGLTRLEPVEENPSKLFGYALELNQPRPLISLPTANPILAHTPSDGSLGWHGELEAVIGREVAINSTKQPSFGTEVKQVFQNANSPVCYIPGSTAILAQPFEITKMGFWLKK